MVKVPFLPMVVAAAKVTAPAAVVAEVLDLVAVVLRERARREMAQAPQILPVVEILAAQDAPFILVLVRRV
jgi:hypothetical protein